MIIPCGVRFQVSAALEKMMDEECELIEDGNATYREHKCKDVLCGKHQHTQGRTAAPGVYDAVVVDGIEKLKVHICHVDGCSRCDKTVILCYIVMYRDIL